MPPRRAEPVSYDPEGARIERLPPVDVALHPLGVIFQSQDDVKLIAFTIDRTFFHKYSNYSELPSRMCGECEKCTRVSASTSCGPSTSRTPSRT